LQATSRKYAKPKQQKFSNFENDSEEVYKPSSLTPLLHELWLTGPGMTVADLGGCAV
jgi:hypothetical protein